MPYSEQDCVEALREAADILGETPSKRQYEDLKLTPAANSILRIMGGWNEAKQAAGLNLIKPGDRQTSEILPKPDGVELPEGYIWEELNPQQRWYYKNREHRVKVKSERKVRLRRWFQKYKRENCECVDCGESHEACIVFHHMDDKEMEVSKMVIQGFGKDRIVAEMESCRTLCANCHRKLHYKEWHSRPVSSQD